MVWQWSSFNSLNQQQSKLVVGDGGNGSFPFVICSYNFIILRSWGFAICWYMHFYWCCSTLLFTRSPVFYRQVVVTVPFGDTAISLLSLVLMLVLDRWQRKSTHANNASENKVVRHTFVCGCTCVGVRVWVYVYICGVQGCWNSGDIVQETCQFYTNIL